jgi:PHD/YefM family antitoxin component YafN of YafNO toxin-antitoxin module
LLSRSRSFEGRRISGARSNGRERLVMISVEEYRRLRRSDRQVLRSGELSDADLAALEETRAPESSKGFDDELKSV